MTEKWQAALPFVNDTAMPPITRAYAVLRVYYGRGAVQSVQRVHGESIPDEWPAALDAVFAGYLERRQAPIKRQLVGQHREGPARKLREVTAEIEEAREDVMALARTTPVDISATADMMDLSIQPERSGMTVSPIENKAEQRAFEESLSAIRDGIATLQEKADNPA